MDLLNQHSRLSSEVKLIGCKINPYFITDNIKNEKS